MKLVKDNTGRFAYRPFYSNEELDEECERVISAVAAKQNGRLTLPISTDDLTKLIERDAADLDLYADLPQDAWKTEGLTEFYPGSKPRVRIARELSEHARQEHRLRTTLSHEYGHVLLHAPLWSSEGITQSMFPDLPSSSKCGRQTILSAPDTDWMEWQAGYVCGALLMPVTAVKELITDFRRQHGHNTEFADDAGLGIKLRKHLAQVFNVSEEAARIRILKLSYRSDITLTPSFLN